MKFYPSFRSELELGLEIRAFERHLLDLFAQGHLSGTVHTCIGQELNSVFISKFLRCDDFILSNHRGHGHYLARSFAYKALFREVLGKASGLSSGLGGSQHIVDDFFISNGIQGGMTPISVGIAYSFKRDLRDQIVVVYIGDGTLGQGVLYESMNLASLLSVPVLFVLENNGWAQSTNFVDAFSGDIKLRVEGFGVEYYSTKTNDLKDLDLTTRKAVDFVRGNKKPAFLEISSQRLMAHSKGDDNRDSALIDELNSLDILNASMLNEPSLKDFYDEKYENFKLFIKEILKEQPCDNVPVSQSFVNKKRNATRAVDVSTHQLYNVAINNALKSILEKTDNLTIIGEDIRDNGSRASKVYGGAFKVTKGLSTMYPNKLINSPISEQAIVGFGTGYSIVGNIAIVEIMFGDFTTLILDQLLQHASKFPLVYNIECKLIVRSPMGGRRGYGPTHSQSLEKHFLGVPGLVVLALNHRLDPTYVYDTILKEVRGPSIVIENKILYTINNKPMVIGYNYNFNLELFPVLEISPKEYHSSITVVCYGEMLNEVEEAASFLLTEYDLFVDVYCFSLISEINSQVIVKSLNKTKKLLVVEEGNGFASFGSELITQTLSCVDERISVSRLNNNTIVPASSYAEVNVLPDRQKIVSTIIEMLKKP